MNKKTMAKPSISAARLLKALKIKPMTVRQLTLSLGYPLKKRTMIQSKLSDLKAQGKVVRLKGGCYGLPKIEKTLIGKLSQKQPGFAFLICEQAQQEDIYLPASNLNQAMPGDTVKVSVYRDNRFGGRLRAQVIEILEHAHQTIVGTLRHQSGYSLLKPDGLAFLRDFIVNRADTCKADDLDKVVATVTKWPTQYEPGQARVKEVLGSRDDPGVAITAIVRRFGLADGFSPAALKQAQVSATITEQATWPDRLDCRDRVIVTIDGADARDFDDAVHCHPHPQGGWHLEVHIADVAHYLKSGTVLDQEARARGTSVYLPDRVLHMLPEALSCGVCSLVPDQDRLTLAAFMTIAEDGKLVNATFQRAVIRSAARLTYDWVEALVQKKDQDNPARPFATMLAHLLAVSRALRAERDRRGNLDFDLPDARIELDEQGQVAAIEKREQLTSHQIIEDCMIAANEAVAQRLARAGLPALFRNHEPPSGDKLEEFRKFLQVFGYEFQPGKPKQASKAFQQLLRSWKGTPEEMVLNHTLLRAMKLAVYSPVNQGHFGLGSSCYTHFTSPIRRYPDLIVHRLLLATMDKKQQSKADFQSLQRQLPDLANHLSNQERKAEKAERLAIQTKQMEFMKARLGETHSGMITTVRSFGFFVELHDYFVEGLVLCASLTDDYYHYDVDERYLVGANTGQVYRTGQSVTITIAAVDEDEIRVYFHIVQPAGKGKDVVTNNPPRLVKNERRTKSDGQSSRQPRSKRRRKK